ncbi:class A beta-lactamase [Nocardia yamanashiensis]|uniref:class A beta-lactamase n=1 Tax=Nocardia yamanashiensis TaxID=209247 RepID=UPI0022B83208|nr:class A beta-lactamase [Nocardia yamanashiensis]
MRFGWRGLAAGLVVVSALAGCGSSEGAAGAKNMAGAGSAGETTLRGLEEKYGARLGVYAVDTKSGREVAYRSGERFAMASTFKALACGALLKDYPLSSGYFDQVIRFGADEVVANSPVAEQRVETGMTVAELCQAAITVSDNTAGNLILRLQGGPGEFTAFLRSLDDSVSRLDRWETELNTDTPGDERDTTSPAAVAADYEKLVLGNALGEPEREMLKGWLLANTTGGQRIRAGLPQGWTVGDKTGTTERGGANDVAVTWTDKGVPVVIALLSSKTGTDAKADNALLADATRAVVSMLN